MYFYFSNFTSNIFLAYLNYVIEMQLLPEVPKKPFIIIMKKVSQPAFTSSQLTIETLEQGVKLESLGSFWCLYC